MRKKLLIPAVLLLVVAGGVFLSLDAPDKWWPSDRDPPEGSSSSDVPSNPGQPNYRGGDPRTDSHSDILGFVRDAAGDPVAGAAVHSLDPARERVLTMEELGAADAVSDRSGRFSVPWALERSADLLVVASGYETTGAAGVIPGSTVEIVLTPSTTVDGRVLSEGGDAVAGAVVRVWFYAEPGVREVRRAVTAPDGAFRLDGVPRSRSPRVFARLDVRASGFAPFSEAVPYPVDGAGRFEWELILEPASALRGRVVDAETGTPVDGAFLVCGPAAYAVSVSAPGPAHQLISMNRVLADDPPSAVYARTRTDESGEFRLEPVPRGRLYVFIGKAGWTTERHSLRVRGGSDEKPTTLRIWRAGGIEGRVIDESGEGVAGATVDVTHAGAAYVPGGRLLPSPAGRVRTDAEGRYRLDEVRAPHEVSLTANAPGGPDVLDRVWRNGRVHGSVRTSAGTTVRAPDLVLPVGEPPAAARFLVTDLEHRPLPGATIYASRSLLIERRTDGSGRAFVRWYPETDARSEGTREVIVRAVGRAPARRSVRPSIDDPPEVEVRLGPGHELRGTVRDGDGSPLPGARVTVCRDDDPSLYCEAVAGDDGTFVVRDLPEGPWRAIVSAKVGELEEEQQTDWQPVPPGATSHDPVIETASAPRGSVVARITAEPSGAPVPGATVTIHANEEIVERAERVPAGRVRIDGVPIGTWPVRVEAAGRLPATTTVSVEANETARLAVSLGSGHRVTGVVRLEADPAPPRGLVHLEPVDLRGDAPWAGPPFLSGHLDADGGFSIAGVPPGRYRICLPLRMRAEAPGFVAGDGSGFEVAGDRSVDVELVPAGELRVTLASSLFPSGAGARSLGGRLTVSDAADRVVVDRRGFYEPGSTTALLPPGKYTCRLVLADGRTDRRQVTLPARENARVELAPK